MLGKKKINAARASALDPLSLPANPTAAARDTSTMISLWARKPNPHRKAQIDPHLGGANPVTASAIFQPDIFACRRNPAGRRSRATRRFRSRPARRTRPNR